MRIKHQETGRAWFLTHRIVSCTSELLRMRQTIIIRGRIDLREDYTPSFPHKPSLALHTNEEQGQQTPSKVTQRGDLRVVLK